MGHLVETLRNRSLLDAVEALEWAHRELRDAAQASISVLNGQSQSWGIEAKRASVSFHGRRCELIGKPSERFVEVVNMLATLERLLDGLAWARDEFPRANVVVCHPSTSHSGASHDETDLVLESEGQELRVEVCDVVSASPGQNGKEQQTHVALGMSSRRAARFFMVVSSEWSQGLTSRNRDWSRYSFRYELVAQRLPRGSHVLEVIPVSANGESTAIAQSPR